MKKALLFALALIPVGFGVYKAWSGPPDGPFETYHENGQLWEKSIYVAGELDGPYEDYHDNGQLMEKGTFKDNEKCGEWFEEGETVTYDPCPPGLEDGN